MKTLISLVLVFTVALSVSCKKVETVSASYSVKVSGLSGTPSYTVIFRMPNGTFETKGPITTANWNSGLLEGYEHGDNMELVLQTSVADGDYEINFVSGGNVIFQQTVNDPPNTQSFYTKVP